jgi:hypothetical protein
MRNLKRILTVLSILFILGIQISCSNKNEITKFESNEFLIGIDSKGNISQLVDKATGNNYLVGDTIAPLMSYQFDSLMHYPVSASFEKESLNLEFDNGIEIGINIKEKDTHVSFEVRTISDIKNVDLIVWGPYRTTINATIGETIGVVCGEEFSLGIQALNTKTIGGYPWYNDDTTPAFDIFEQEDYSDMNEKGKRHTLYRVEAAKPEKFGSTLQAYSRNRFEERIISTFNHDKFVSPLYDDSGVIGSKIALFGCPVDETLYTIGKIEETENLPHPLLNGNWAKKAKAASSAYLIYDFDESSINKAIEYTRQAGLQYLYHPGPFKNWGHFELDEDKFPNGWDGLKRCVELAENEGIHVGLHTLSNFITTDDPYVTPVPDKRLGKVGSSAIVQGIDESVTEIPIESPEFFIQMNKNNLHTVMIGDELVRYETVSDKEPWKLIGCERGAWGTEPSAHESGKKISKLVDHAYKVFLTDIELSIEMAERLAELFNYCGLRQISFDGLEGLRSTGMGNYGELLFVTTWWNNLSDDIKDHVIIDASRTTHYFWHIYTRMNWGEPWYAGFRESQTDTRLRNQKYFQRNMMPAMLGWFSLRDNTPIEDIEWMLARSAAFDAGYAFVTKKEPLEKNGQSQQILELIGEWEKARMAQAFSEDQKKRMMDISNEFHLKRIDDQSWEFYPVGSFKFQHQDKVKQPGEPLFSVFKFENPMEDVPMNFIITAKDAAISNIQIELNNSRSINLPIKVMPGETIRYHGGSELHLLDKNLNFQGKIDIDPDFFQLTKGSQTLLFDCDFEKEGDEPSAKIEVRIFGEPELINSTK